MKNIKVQVVTDGTEDKVREESLQNLPVLPTHKKRKRMLQHVRKCHLKNKDWLEMKQGNKNVNLAVE